MGEQEHRKAAAATADFVALAKKLRRLSSIFATQVSEGAVGPQEFGILR